MPAPCGVIVNATPEDEKQPRTLNDAATIVYGTRIDAAGIYQWDFPDLGDETLILSGDYSFPEIGPFGEMFVRHVDPGDGIDRIKSRPSPTSGSLTTLHTLPSNLYSIEGMSWSPVDGHLYFIEWLGTVPASRVKQLNLSTLAVTTVHDLWPTIGYLHRSIYTDATDGVWGHYTNPAGTIATTYRYDISAGVTNTSATGSLIIGGPVTSSTVLGLNVVTSSSVELAPNFAQTAHSCGDYDAALGGISDRNRVQLYGTGFIFPSTEVLVAFVPVVIGRWHIGKVPVGSPDW